MRRNKLSVSVSQHTSLESRAMLSGATQAIATANLVDADSPENNVFGDASASAGDTGTATGTVTIRKIPRKGGSPTLQQEADAGAIKGGLAEAQSLTGFSAREGSVAAEASIFADGLTFAFADSNIFKLFDGEPASANASASD